MGIYYKNNRIDIDTIPVKSVTQAEYDALTEEEKRSGTLYVTPQQNYVPPTDNGAVPTGAIVSFLGLRAPVGYLACDGSEYEISKYARLAMFIQDQFGTVSHFGGDGTTTFAVPDLRNLFLRGYHGDAVEQLSGEVGEKQEGTQFPYYESTLTSSNVVRGSATVILPTDVDTKSGTSNGVYHNGGTYDPGTKTPLYFTSHPVNTAVLYCIKT